MLFKSLIIILILFSLIIISLFIFKKLKYDNKINPDIVITWVENNEKFEKEKNKWKKVAKIKNEDRFNDERRYTDNQELKYCLRSIEKNFPNYNCIYLVVKDDQYPKYLKNENTKKFKIIKHSDIIPKEYLPTFNSHSIECFLHHIPNLQEYYIYMNDDFMFYNEVDPSFFIMENGTPYTLHQTDKMIEDIVPHINKIKINTEEYEYGKGFLFNMILLHKIGVDDDIYEMSHVPKMYRKSYDKKIEKFFKSFKYDKYKDNLYDNTAKSKFRKNDNLYLVSLLKGVLYKNWFNGEYKKVDSLTIMFTKKHCQKNGILVVKNKNNKFICVENVDREFYKTYKTNMEKIFPNKSSFEISFQ
jgi:hypothetical protein